MENHFQEVFNQLEIHIAQKVNEYKGKDGKTEGKNLWMPSQIISFESHKEIQKNCNSIPEYLKECIILNLLTEEGLPHFHRLVAQYMGESFKTWNYIWTAEEDRHGILIHNYCLLANCFDMERIEKLQFEYLKNGFDPDWENPYQLLAYTSMQEKATQISHANIGRVLSSIEPIGNKVFARVASDEARHYGFYSDVFGSIVKIDPENAIKAFYLSARKFVMPGASIPGYTELSSLMQKHNLFTTQHFIEIINVLIKKWGIEQYDSPYTQKIYSLVKILNRMK